MEKTTLPTTLPAGFSEVAADYGVYIEVAPDGVYSNDKNAAEALYAAYSGGAAELAWYKAQKKAELDLFLETNFDLIEFIKASTTTNTTGAQVGTFLATIKNNFTTKKNLIAAATTVAQVAAIVITTGWPVIP